MTPHVKLEALPNLVRQIIETRNNVVFDRGHFVGFSNSSLDVEFVYYVENSNYNFYMDQQQLIFLTLLLYLKKKNSSLRTRRGH